MDRFEGQNAVSGYGEDYVAVNGQPYRSSLIVFPDRPVESWDVDSPERLTPESLNLFADLPLEIVLLGTGPSHRLVHPRVYAHLSAARIGVEIMNTAAACRTYNILLAEGRKVAAALIL
ncbi:MAG: hypothetical protein GC151_07560 [Betaproteobacteria bacterium]|nr:hypothetical protein [Betaproteobacteria bacterium]